MKFLQFSFLDAKHRRAPLNSGVLKLQKLGTIKRTHLHRNVLQPVKCRLSLPPLQQCFSRKVLRREKKIIHITNFERNIFLTQTPAAIIFDFFAPIDCNNWIISAFLELSSSYHTINSIWWVSVFISNTTNLQMNFDHGLTEKFFHFVPTHP